MKVSVLMSVHNGADHLEKALTSIFNQTYKKLEVIIINDASTDSSPQILDKFPVKIIRNQNNLGLTKSLNIGLKYCSGDYIARLDHDDTWHPEKLAKQTAYLKKNPDVGLIGTNYKNIYNHKSKRITLPSSNKEIKKYIWRRNPFGHSCVMIKRDLLKKVNGYDENLQFAQDRDLWFRLMPHTNFANIPEVLVTRHVAPTQKPKQIMQMQTNIALINKYTRIYRPGPQAYIGLIEPTLVLAARKLGL